MKTLHLLRHAKSDRDNPRIKDHERPLAKRGINAAKLMAEHLAAQNFRTDHVYCSTSRRTRETFELMRKAFRRAAVTFDDALYLADRHTLLTLVREVPDRLESIVLIGHNPGFHELAVALAKEAADTKDLHALDEKYPTGALCSLQFKTSSWREIGPGAAKLTAFVRPRDLE